MNKYICPCCGGRINRASMTCEYCGTEFKEERDALIRVETFSNPVVTLGARLLVDRGLLYAADPETVAEHSMNELAYRFSKEIKKYMDVEFCIDPYSGQPRLDAKIKVVNPVHKPTEALAQLRRE